MAKEGFLSLAVLTVILSTAIGSCPEQESCADRYSPSIQNTESRPSCTDLQNYMDCLAPCENRPPPLGALEYLYDLWCKNSQNHREERKIQERQHVKVFVDMLTVYSSNGSLDAAGDSNQLAACGPLLHCISDVYIDTSYSNVSDHCSGVMQAMLDCWGNTTDNCTISEDLSRRVNESQGNIERECLEVVEVVTVESIKEESATVTKTSAIAGILNISLSPVERDELEHCSAFAYCRRMLKTDSEVTSDSENYIGKTCQHVVPEFKCLVSEMDTCEIERLTMLKFHRMIGYAFVYCKMVSSASRDMQERKLTALLDELKPDSNVGACDELLTCAGDAEISKIQRRDRQEMCVMLQKANECFQENMGACPKGEMYQQIYDENQSEEQDQCVTAGCDLVQDNQLLTALGFFTCLLVNSILGAAFST